MAGTGPSTAWTDHWSYLLDSLDSDFLLFLFHRCEKMDFVGKPKKNQKDVLENATVMPHEIKVQLLLFPLSPIDWPLGHIRPCWCTCPLRGHGGKWIVQHLRPATRGIWAINLINQCGGWGKYFQCMETQRKGCQGGNLIKIATFSMEIRVYSVKKSNRIETKILHWKQIFRGIFYPWFCADKGILREDHQCKSPDCHLLVPVARINPRPALTWLT